MKTALASLASAIGMLGVQVVALVILQPAEFGLFSSVYLLGALLLSISLSVVCDSWARLARSSETVRDDWGSYGAASFYLCVLGGVVAGVVALFLPPLAPYWWLAAVAVFAMGYRSSARFYSLHQSRWNEVLPGDVVGAMIAVVGGLWAFFAADDHLGAVMAVWAASTLGAAVLSRMPVSWRPMTLIHWGSRHRTTIGPLLRDSLLMDAAAIGTPYAMIPLLGVADFGLYRAVSNVAAPVRLVLAPIRPRLVLTTPTARLGILVTAAAIVTGMLAAATVWAIDALGLDLGTLSHLGALAIPTGLFVAANLQSHTFYLLARGHSAPRTLYVGRAVQTVLGIVLPIVGALLWGLEGAVWLYAVATTVSAVVWTVLVYRGRRIT
ncbi:hypothetical protein [Microbacterium sp. Root180]|uniref:hypothetical protein n=1 Tax=Microbacterium sp. Root180 TaxID=1736483 RepID=UPI0006F2496C|nr:hypothetical protein [Microbacterium sp. Root180]KRB36249.1 hypothetical protein ASD93_09125 [Microbacterium sp. Root180]